jgi:predicted Zn-dependent protease
LALADNEAQVAGVLAHEIGHITARHTAERYGQAVLAQAATLGAGIFLGGTEARLLGTGATLALRSWSREQELEADMLGVRYLSRAGFDTDAVAGFLSRLQAHSRLEAELRGEPGKADEFSLLRTHPRTVDRIEQAIEEAGVKQVAKPIVARDIYLRKIDGIIYGDSPKEGIIRERAFLHPMLRFTFQVPTGFRLFNSKEQVVARGPGGAAIIFDRVRAGAGTSAIGYMTQSWADGIPLRDVERININGMRAATGRTRMRTKKGPRDFRLVAIRYDPKTIYRFLFVTSPQQTDALSDGLKRTTYSFRRLSAAEAKQIKPLHLRIHSVKTGDTAPSIARQMAFQDRKLDRFLVLNGLTRGSQLQLQELVKIVTE